MAAWALAPTASVAQQADAGTFRLLTFATGDSGPRLGATRGDGDNDIVDIHNAIGFLYRIDAPELRDLPPIPIDMRSLIEVHRILPEGQILISTSDTRRSLLYCEE